MGMSMMSGLARQRCPWADSTDLNSIPGRETRARGFAPTPNFASSVFNVCVHNVFNVYSVCVCVGGWVFFLFSIELERVPGEASAASNHTIQHSQIL